MAADLATVAFHSLSAEARICASVWVCGCECVCPVNCMQICTPGLYAGVRCGCECECGCEYLCECSCFCCCVCALSVCHCASSLCSYCCPCNAHRPTCPPATPSFTLRPFSNTPPRAHIPQSLSFRFADCFCADFALILNVFYACCFCTLPLAALFLLTFLFYVFYC